MEFLNKQHSDNTCKVPCTHARRKMWLRTTNHLYCTPDHSLFQAERNKKGQINGIIDSLSVDFQFSLL